MSGRFFVSIGNVLFSLILGAVALGLGLFYFPDATLRLFRWAGSVREALVSGNWPVGYDLVDERQIVYMGFVLATRILVGLIIIGAKLAGSSRAGQFPISDA